MNVLLNCDADWAWRMWGGSSFLEKLSGEAEVKLFCNKNYDVDGKLHNKIEFISLPDNLRKYHNKHTAPDKEKKEILQYIRKILKDIDVVVLASAGERFINLELIKLCKELGKKSVFMVEGLNNADYGIPVWPDKILVWGQAMYETFTEYVKNTGPCPKEILEITGQPRFDIYHNLYRPKRPYKVVMVAPPFYNSEYAENTADLIMGGLKNFGGNNLVMVHPHPSIGTDLYRDMNKKYREEGIYISKDSLEEFWHLADVCITAASTIAIEAMYFDIPVIIADKDGLIKTQRHFKNFLQSNAYLYATTHKEVENAITESLKNPNKFENERKKVVENYLYKVDGKSSKRCIEAILKW